MFLRWTRSDKWLYAAEVDGKMTNDSLSLTFYFGPSADPTSSGDKKTIELIGTKVEEISLLQGSVNVNLSVSWLNPPTATNVSEAIDKVSDFIKSGYTPLLNISGNIVEGSVANVGIDSLLMVDIG